VGWIVGQAGANLGTKGSGGRLRLAEYAANGTKIRDYEVPALPFHDLSVTRNGDRVAFSIGVGPRSGTWVLEPGQGVLRRITEGGSYSDPVWTPDGRAVAMARKRGDSFDLVLQPVDQQGRARPLLEAPWDQYPETWSRDGRSLVYCEDHPETGYDLWILRRGPDEVWRRRPLLRTPEQEAFAAISPDDRRLAFASGSDRRTEIFVIDLLRAGPPVQVSDAGGVFPFWSPTGDRLHYIADDRLMTVEADQIGLDVVRIERSATEVPGLWMAAPASVPNRFVVATVD
jgi:Tol biopolymer transport system component